MDRKQRSREGGIGGMDKDRIREGFVACLSAYRAYRSDPAYRPYQPTPQSTYPTRCRCRLSLPLHRSVKE